MNAVLSRIEELTYATSWPVCHQCGRSITAGGYATTLDGDLIDEGDVADYIYDPLEHLGEDAYAYEILAEDGIEVELFTYHDEHGPHPKP